MFFLLPRLPASPGRSERQSRAGGPRSSHTGKAALPNTHTHTPNHAHTPKHTPSNIPKHTLPYTHTPPNMLNPQTWTYLQTHTYIQTCTHTPSTCSHLQTYISPNITHLQKHTPKHAHLQTYTHIHRNMHTPPNTHTPRHTHRIPKYGHTPKHTHPKPHTPEHTHIPKHAHAPKHTHAPKSTQTQNCLIYDLQNRFIYRELISERPVKSFAVLNWRWVVRVSAIHFIVLESYRKQEITMALSWKKKHIGR